MKRYLVFGGDCYYPRGGWSDLLQNCDTIEEVRECLDDWIGEGKWCHVVDTTNQARLLNEDIWPLEDK